MRFRRLFFVLLGLLLVTLPATAEASRRREHRARRIASVTVTADGSGSLLAVTFAGHPRPHLLRSTDPIATYAVADIDNDGDLDILAASDRSGLLVWRNAGRGRFVLALPAARHVAQRPAAGLRHIAHVDEGPVAADDRYDAAMPRAPANHGSDPAALVQTTASVFTPSGSNLPHSGRAPPQLSV